MDSFTNFLINSFTSILRHATREPDIAEIHSLLDRVSGAASNRTTNHSQAQSQSSSLSTPYTSNTDTNEPPAPVQSVSRSASDETSMALSPTSSPTSNSYSTLLPQPHGGTDSNDLNYDEDEYHSAMEEDINENADEMDTDDYISDHMSNFSFCQPVSESIGGNNGDGEEEDGDVSDDELYEFIDESTSNSHNIQFPSGKNVRYKVRGQKTQLGWATVQYTQYRGKTNTLMWKKCLGVHACTQRGCTFTSRPRLPKERHKNVIPRYGRVTHCKIHKDTELVHVPCPVLIKCRRFEAENYVRVKNKGTHNHLTPAPIRPTAEALKKLAEEIRRDPGAKPISLVTGTEGQEPVWRLDKSLVNIDRVRYLRRKELAELALAKPSEMTAFDRDSGLELITESSLKSKDGCIIMQTPLMRRVMNQSETASQTDTIEGFVTDPYLPSANLTVTSTFCHVREKWVATQFGILFGKSEEHYGIYFLTLLRNMTYTEFKDFVDEYLGMVCDFSVHIWFG